MSNPPMPYVLEPGSTFTADPDSCWHCARNPGYPHRHWQQKEPPVPAAREPNWLWRAAFRLYGDGGAEHPVR